jgi:hypothetical protein
VRHEIVGRHCSGEVEPVRTIYQVIHNRGGILTRADTHVNGRVPRFMVW